MYSLCPNAMYAVIENYGRIPQINGDISSHRCEAFGVLSGIITLYHLLIWKKENTTYNPTSIKTIFICDNKAVIDSINKLKHKKILSLKDYYSPDFDVLNTIIQIYRKININELQITFKHVKGHQDRNGTTLNEEAMANIYAHNMATEGLTLPQRKQFTLPGLLATLQVENKMITAHHNKSLQFTFHSIRMREFLMQK
jgi:hypothetical protein